MQLHIKDTQEHIRGFKIIQKSISLEIMVKWSVIGPIYIPKSTKQSRHQFNHKEMEIIMKSTDKSI